MGLFKNLKIFNFTNGIVLDDVIMRKGQGVSYFVENDKVILKHKLFIPDKVVVR